MRRDTPADRFDFGSSGIIRVLFAFDIKDSMDGARKLPAPLVSSGYKLSGQTWTVAPICK